MKVYVSLSIALAMTLGLTGCGKSGDDMQTVYSRLSGNPLPGFKVIARKCQEALVESDRVEPGLTEGFVRTVILPKTTSFDVMKTDSLVSPYTAYIKLSFLEETSVAPTQDALTAPSTVTISTVNHWKVDYALQDGRWVLQRALYSFDLPAAGIAEGIPVPADVKTLFKRVPNLERACRPS